MVGLGAAALAGAVWRIRARHVCATPAAAPPADVAAAAGGSDQGARAPAADHPRGAAPQPQPAESILVLYNVSKRRTLAAQKPHPRALALFY